MDDLLKSAENELGEDKPEIKAEAPSLHEVIKEVTGPKQALAEPAARIQRSHGRPGSAVGKQC